MKNMVRFTFGIAAAILLVAANASATVVADWSFETSYTSITGSSTSLGPLSPETGAGSASGVHAATSTWSSPAGIQPPSLANSFHSFSVNTWAIGDYFQFQVDLSVSGANVDATVDWDQTGSGTGPGDFIFQYSSNNSTYTTASSYTVLLNTSPFWSATVFSTKYHYTLDLSAINSIENDGSVYFRLVNNSGTAINGASIGTGGTDRVDNFRVQAVPEPSTIMLVGFGLAGSLLAIRRRRS